MLRICAALMLLVWVAASGFCSVEHLFAHAESDAAPASANASHSHDSDKHDDGEQPSCCDSLKATPQLGGSIVLNHPDFGKLLPADFLSLAQTPTFLHPEASVLRQPQTREWLSTPEVYLGPAFRSHAPPVLL